MISLISFEQWINKVINVGKIISINKRINIENTYWKINIKTLIKKIWRNVNENEKGWDTERNLNVDIIARNQ